MNCKIEMAVTHRVSLLFIILISGFKLGITAPADAPPKECALPLKPDWSFFSPLIFSLNGTLISTENAEDIKLSEGSEVLLSCSPNSFLNNAAEKVTRAVCRDQGLVVNGEEKDFVSELSCELRTIEEIITPVPGCPRTARSIEFGYLNPIKETSYVLGEACYSTKQGRTLFIRTRLRAGKMDVTELALKVRNKSYFHQEHPTKIYRNELMKALRREEYEDFLQQVLESKNVPKIGFKKFINEDLLTHKQYQPVTKLPWNYAIVNDADELENIEKLQDDIANLTLKHVEVYSGSHGTLTLKNNEGVQVEISLKENKFPVPRYIWYVVRAENKAAAFAVFNRATISEKDRQKDSFCASKCEEITWLTSLLENKNYKKVEAGYVLCCELNEFRRTVVEMPQLDNVSELLK